MKGKRMRRQGGQRGFTLLEVLISSAIFGVVISAVYTMYITNQTTFLRGENKIDLQQNARVAMALMAREVRMAGYDPSNVIPAQASQTAVQVANANSTTIIADVTGDNVSDRVTYRLQGGQIVREISSWVGGAWTPNPPDSGEVAGSVTALAFTYYDASNNVTATLANIRRITNAITVQATAAGRQETFPLTIDVRLRNLQ
jgi:type IV pilus assembly protein PilW